MPEVYTGEVTNPGSEPVAAVQGTESEMDALETFIQAGEAEGNEAGSTAEAEGETENAQAAAPEGAPEEDRVTKGIKGRLQAAEAKADKAGYERGLQEARKAWEAKEAEYAEKLSKYAEMEMDADARTLAAKEKCSIELAKRILRLERGMPEPKRAENAPARDEKGRFAPGAPDVNARAETLYRQAREVSDAYGVDVLKAFSEDAEVKRKIGSGEWDFKDVALSLVSGKRERAPKPVTSGGGNGGAQTLNFGNMTTKQFAEFNKRIGQGAVYRAR